MRTELRTQEISFSAQVFLSSLPLSTTSVFPQTLYRVSKVQAPRTPELFHFVNANPDENTENCKTQAKLPRALGDTQPALGSRSRLIVSACQVQWNNPHLWRFAQVLWQDNEVDQGLRMAAVLKTRTITWSIWLTSTVTKCNNQHSSAKPIAHFTGKGKVEEAGINSDQP